MTAVRDEAAFLDAWRKGVAVAGWEFFGDGTGAGTSKWDFAPRIDDIERRIGVLSSTEAIFLAAMVSFYNDRIGGEMLADLEGHPAGLVAVTAGLDGARRHIIADLLIAYPGW
jgi:hypothetical protein